MPDTTNISDTFADEFTSHAVDTLRFTETVRADVLALLRGLEQQLVRAINDTDISGVQRTAYQIARMNAMLVQVRKMIISTYQKIETKTREHTTALGAVVQSRALKILNGVFGVALFATALSPSELKAITADPLVQGHDISAWWAKQATDLQYRFSAQIRMGVMAGESNALLVQRIRGTPSGSKEKAIIDDEPSSLSGYSGGIMDSTDNEATTLVRTATQEVMNDVHLKLFKDNDDIFEGIQWLSVLDGRTTVICRGLSAAAWDFEGKPLKASPKQLKYPGPPPIHFNCRSMVIPIAKNAKQLADVWSAKGFVGADQLSPDVLARMNGQVASGLDYDEWLGKRSVAFQQEVLGMDKWNLWNDDKLSLSQMIDQSGNPLSIAQLRRKAGLAAA